MGAGIRRERQLLRRMALEAEREGAKRPGFHTSAPPLPPHLRSSTRISYSFTRSEGQGA